MKRQRVMMLGVATCAALLIGVDAARAQVGVGVGVTRGYGGYRSVGVGVGVGYPAYYGGYYGGYRYPGYYGNYGAYRPYYGYGYTGYYPGYYGGNYFNYNTYTPSVAAPTYVPVPVPVYGSGSGGGVVQASYTAPANAALVTVNVPANAEIWFSGDKTSQTGPSRRFETPPLEPGSNYSYEIRARWTENGKERDETKKVAVRANDRVAVEFP